MTMVDTRSGPILVVDDYADGREMLAEYLTFRGFSVASAQSGVEAISVAAQVHPAIVLMDLRMPDLDGWEATRLLRKDPQTRQVMIVAVTAHALATEVERALDAGCDAVVSKPYDLASFADALIIALRKGPGAVKEFGARTRTETLPKPSRQTTRPETRRPANPESDCAKTTASPPRISE
jgi:two-component system cell cycle response regulator DivK